jgi:hypothetical protein
VVITLSVWNALCDTVLFCLVDFLLSSVIVLLDPLILLSLHDKTVIRYCNLLLLFMVVSFHLISVWRYLRRYVCLRAWLLSRDLIAVGYHDWSRDWSSFDCLTLLWQDSFDLYDVWLYYVLSLICMITAPSVLLFICLMTALSVLLCIRLTCICVVLPCSGLSQSVDKHPPNRDQAPMFQSGNCARLSLSWSCM